MAICVGVLHGIFLNYAGAEPQSLANALAGPLSMSEMAIYRQLFFRQLL